MKWLLGYLWMFFNYIDKYHRIVRRSEQWIIKELRITCDLFSGINQPGGPLEKHEILVSIFGLRAENRNCDLSNKNQRCRLAAELRTEEQRDNHSLRVESLAYVRLFFVSARRRRRCKASGNSYDSALYMVASELHSWQVMWSLHPAHYQKYRYLSPKRRYHAENILQRPKHWLNEMCLQHCLDTGL
jgi:hypothetical protein